MILTFFIVFIELLRYYKKLFICYYFKFERNLFWILLPQELPKVYTPFFHVLIL